MLRVLVSCLAGHDGSWDQAIETSTLTSHRRHLKRSNWSSTLSRLRLLQSNAVTGIAIQEIRWKLTVGLRRHDLFRLAGILWLTNLSFRHRFPSVPTHMLAIFVFCIS